MTETEHLDWTCCGCGAVQTLPRGISPRRADTRSPCPVSCNNSGWKGKPSPTNAEREARATYARQVELAKLEAAAPHRAKRTQDDPASLALFAPIMEPKFL